MAIDIRAKVTLKLDGNTYDVISASVSDSYVQESGMILTGGDAEIKGIVVPQSGKSIEIKYLKNGIERKIPRSLRVLSSFADPFTGTTKISLGCLFTYLSSSTAPPVSESGEEEVVSTANQLNCLNSYEYPLGSDYPPPIYAKDIAAKCFSSLGLAGPSALLSNRFLIDKFVYDQPYVNILGDLYVSEGYILALTANENVVAINLETGSGTFSGPNLTVDKIISISQINSGDTEADNVVVKYTTTVLEPDLENIESTTFNSDFTFEESYGEPKAVRIQLDSGGSVYAGNYVPYSNTTQEYGEDNSWSPDTCIIYSSGEEDADLSNSVIKKIEKTRLCVGEEASDYVAQYYIDNQQAALAAAVATADRIVTTTYEYDTNGSVIREVEITQDPEFCLWGKINVSFMDETGFLPFPITLQTVAKKITTREYQYPPLPRYPYPPGVNLTEFLENYSVEQSKEANIVTTIVEEYKHPLYYTNRQITVSRIAINNTFTGTALQDFIGAIIVMPLIQSGRQVSVETGRVKTAAVYRPKKTDMLIRSNGKKIEEYSSVEYITGSTVPGTKARLQEYSMPYQDSDIFSPTGEIIKGSAQSYARKYGKIQNDIKRGHRYGMSVQTIPEYLPTAAYSTFFVELNGYVVQYQTDGMTWTADSSGIIVSCDALLVGGVSSVAGALGNPFFPVAPGITALPTKPPSEDNTPSAVLGSVVDVGTTPQTVLNTAFPGATNNEAVLDEGTNNFWVSDGAGVWTNIGPTFGEYIPAATTVPVVNVLTTLNLITKTKLRIDYFGYGLTTTVVEPVIPAIRSIIDVSTPVLMQSAVVNVSGSASNQNGSLAIGSGYSAIQLIPTGVSFAGDIYNENIDLATVSISGAVYGLPALAGPAEAVVFGFETILYGSEITCEPPFVITPPAITEGVPIITDTEKRWYDYSLLIDGTATNGGNNRVTFVNPLSFGAGDYCVEFWIYVPSVGSTGIYSSYYGTVITFGSGFSVDMDINPANYAPGDFGFYHYAGVTSGNEIYHGPGNPTATGSFDTWTHVAAYRLNGFHYIAVNGVVDQNYLEEALIDVHDFDLGSYGKDCAINDWLGDPGFPVNEYGLIIFYLDDLRLAANDAIYTATSFSPPSTPFSNGGSGDFAISAPQPSLSVSAQPTTGSVVGNIFDYTNFASTTGLELLSIHQISGNNIYLTNTTSNDVGNVWRSTALSYQNSFRVEWRMECTGGSGADGFTLQWYTLNTLNGLTGGGGGRLYDSIHGLNFATFFVQKFRWYQSGSYNTPTLEQSNTLSGNGWRQNVYYWFDYDYDLAQGKVYYSTTASKPATPSHTLNSFVFDSAQYYIGIGAATGGATDYHILKSWKVYTV